MNDIILEDKVIEILNDIQVDVTADDIEACHRLPKARNDRMKKTIVRFVNRKIVEKCMKLKKNAVNLNFQKLNFPPSSKIFISHNLNSHYKKLDWRCRSLKKNNHIFSYKFQNEAFLIKTSKDERAVKIMKEEYLFNIFPGFFIDDILSNSQ